jgi:hypothetical protein
MEQTLLPPSQFRLTSMSIDSRFADQYYHGTSDFMIRLPSPMRNVMRVALSSVELPENVYVFSAKAGNTCFYVDDVKQDISAGNYTGDELAIAITAKLPAGGLCSYNSITDRFTFSTAGASYTVTLACSDPTPGLCDGPCPDGGITSRKRFWGLGYNMGFRITYDKVDARNQTIYDATQYPFTVTSTAPLTACQSPQITVPPYALLQLRCPDMMENTLHRTADGSFVQALAKLVLRSGAYQIQFDDGGNVLRKENTFQSPTSMTQFRISLVDAYGQLLEMGDTDWSMTFEIMEVVNSCQYNELNRAYGRC